MALQNNYTQQTTGVTLPAAYIKIEAVELSKTPPQANLTISVYRDVAARQSGVLRAVDTFSYTVMDGVQSDGSTQSCFTNSFGAPPYTAAANETAPVNVDDVLLSQAYAALKALPAAKTVVSGATDC